MKNKLDPEFKAKWVAALRSGKYLQGKGSLCHKGKYCCLGVGAELSDQLLPPGPNGYRKVKDGSSGFWFGPNDELRLESNGITSYLLAQMNDEKKSFDEIADWIEENL